MPSKRPVHSPRRTTLKRHNIDSRRPSPSKRGYDRRWYAVRNAFLSCHSVLQRDGATHRVPNALCRMCWLEGRTTAAVEVDHIVPINQGGDRYWFGNLQGLCTHHHSRKTVREDGGFGRPVKARDGVGGGGNSKCV